MLNQSRFPTPSATFLSPAINSSTSNYSNSNNTISGVNFKQQLNKSLLDKQIPKTHKSEIPLSTFCFLFSEIIQYSLINIRQISELEKKLGEIGFRVGVRMSELVLFREMKGRRETKLLQLLLFINSTLWKTLFGKQADSLERSTEADDECKFFYPIWYLWLDMIIDNEPLISRFISVPKDLSQLNCNAFTAGLLEAVLEGSHFYAKVTAHSTPNAQFPQKTTFLIKL